MPLVAAQLQLPLSLKDQALVLMAVLYDREKMTDLLAGLPEQRRQQIQAGIEPLKALSSKKQIQFALARLKTLLDANLSERIEEIHITWLAHYLATQPPLLAGLMLKTLPGKMVPQVLQLMEPEVTTLLQQRLRGAVPSKQLRELTLVILARRFHLLTQFSATGSDPFELVFLLNGDELLILTEELGTSELAMAFQKLPARDFDIILSKLPPPMREKVKIKLQQYEQTSSDRIAQARQSFLHLQDENYVKGKLIEFTGLNILAMALTGYREDQVASPAYRLPRLEGEILLRLCQRLAGGPQPERTQTVRQEIQTMVTYLAEIDRIRSLWKYV